MRRLSIALILLALACVAAAPASAVAPPSACPDQTDPASPTGPQLRAMLCLTNFARHAHGLPPLAGVGVLDRAAGQKSADILRCGSFSHEACGRPFTYWMDRLGYRGCAEGENIAWGNGRLGSPRAIFQAWMHSAGHRENILGPYSQIGIGLRVGSLEGNAGAHVWAQDFGNPC